jgi:hypothetical protein
VVGEFARALGDQVSEGLQAAGGAAAPAAPGAHGAGMPAVGPVPGTPMGGSPGEDLTVPPAALQHPPTQQVGFGNRETVTTGQGGAQPGAQAGMPPPPGGQAGLPPPGGQAAGGYGWAPGRAGAPPAGTGWPGQGGTQPGPPGMPPPGGGRSPRQGMVLGIGAAALVVVYLVIAGVGHLPPFGKPAAPKPSASSSVSVSASTSPTPAASATTFQPTSGDRTLESLIPADVSANGSCTPVHTPAFGSTAEMHCAGAPNIPAAYVQYYLFASKSGMNAAYSTYLSDFAQRSKNTGRCHRISGTAAFSSFSPCETQFSLGSTAEGRIAEYFYKGSPDISCIFAVDKVLVDMQGSDGNALIRWWDHSHNWINS